jgi:N-acetylmuramoyl-L-alanine amidase
VILPLLLLPSTATPASPSPSRTERVQIAKQQLARAQRLRADLEGTPQANRSEADYLKVIQLYRRVSDTAPFSGLAPEGLAGAAELYAEMGRLHGAKYFSQAIETYEFLRRAYPASRYSDDALFTIGQIQRQDLGDLPKALATFETFLKTYPRSRQVPQARRAIQEIRAEQAQAARASSTSSPPPPPAGLTGARVQVRNIRFWNTKDYTRVVVDLDDTVQFQGARIDNPDRIFFDLFNTELSTVLVGKTFDIQEGLLNRVRIAENRAGVTRVVMEVNKPQDYSVFSLPNPFRLVVDIRGTVEETLRQPGTQTAAPPATAAPEAAIAKAPLPQPPSLPQPTQDGNHPLSRALGLKIGRIVLDPGHGGHDTGTIGPTGFMEKDLALDVARRLSKLLQEQLGAEVLFTREDDTYVPLENRTALANEKQADLFLSIHANSSRNRRVRGVETFYLNFTSDPEALELAARENALSQKSIHELQDIVRQITRNEKIDESRELASEVQRHLYGGLHKRTTKASDRGVKKAPFVVLLGANMPSVLTEIAFLSNAEDERLLKSPQGRQKVAEAIYAGLVQYLKNLNSLAVARKEGAAP